MTYYYIIINGIDKLNQDEVLSLKVLLEELMVYPKIEITKNNLYAQDVYNKDISWVDFIHTTNINFLVDLKLYESVPFDNEKKALEHLEQNKNKPLFVLTYNNDKLLFYSNLNHEITEEKKKALFKTLYYDKEFLRSIKIYLEENQNKSRAAKIANLHRNSLDNRLDKFYRITGYDVRNFKDATFIYLFLKDE